MLDSLVDPHASLVLCSSVSIWVPVSLVEVFFKTDVRVGPEAGMWLLTVMGTDSIIGLWEKVEFRTGLNAETPFWVSDFAFGELKRDLLTESKLDKLVDLGSVDFSSFCGTFPSLSFGFLDISVVFNGILLDFTDSSFLSAFSVGFGGGGALFLGEVRFVGAGILVGDCFWGESVVEILGESLESGWFWFLARPWDVWAARKKCGTLKLCIPLET